MPRLLVVDDDPSIRNLFATALRDFGEVDVATDGASALVRLRAARYDFVVMDLHMPGIDGIFVLKVLSEKDGPNKDTPICVATADTAEETKARALKHRALYVVTKPVSIVALRAMVAGVLGSPKKP